MQNAINRALNGINDNNGRYSIFYMDKNDKKVELTKTFHIISLTTTRAVEFSLVPIEAGHNLSENAIVNFPNISLRILSRAAVDILNRFIGYKQAINNAKNIAGNLTGKEFLTDRAVVEASQQIQEIVQNARRLFLQTPDRFYDNIRIVNIAQSEVTYENSMRWLEYTLEVVNIEQFKVQSTKIRKAIKTKKTMVTQASKKQPMLAKAKTEATAPSQAIQSVPTQFTLDPSKSSTLAQSRPVGGVGSPFQV